MCPVTAGSSVVTELVAPAAVSLEKSATHHGEGEVGDTVSYSVTRPNAGGVPLTDVIIADEMDVLSELTYNWPSTTGVLAPGEHVTATAEYTVTAADVDAGEILNEALISGTDPSGTRIMDDDTNKVTLTGLAVTGASIVTALGIALAIIVLGIVLLRTRGRKETV